MTYDLLNTKDWQQSDNMAFLLRETGDRRCPTENAFYLQVDSARRMDPEGERRIAAQICTALNSIDSAAWQDEVPTEGRWHLSVPPDVRTKWGEGFDWPMEVAISVGGLVVIDRLHYNTRGIAGPMFFGAKWQRRTVPRDPFAGGGE